VPSRERKSGDDVPVALHEAARLALLRRGVLAVALTALGGLLAAAPAQGANCPHRLPVRANALTANAVALQRVGIVRVSAEGGARVRDLHVTLTRGGRTVASGSRALAVKGSANVRLDFRRKAVPGRAGLVVTGRVVGCEVRRQTQRTLRLDGRDLSLKLISAEREADGGGLAVTLGATGKRPVSDLRAKILTAGGETVAAVSRRSPLGTRTLIEFAPRQALAAGRHWLLVTADVGAETGRSSFAEAIDVAAQPVPQAPVPAGPPPGAVVQEVSINWSGGRWQGSDSAGFSAPGIGEGQLVCRPDTQWIRLFPSDRSRDVSMMMWTFRDWEGGSEFTIREPEMTRYTGPDFNEGFNKFQPAEKRSHGSFMGVAGDGLPAAGAFGSGRSPTEVRVSWSWDFSDPANARCSVVATLTSQGAGITGAIARGFSLAWRGAAGLPADTTTATPVPGFGTVRLRCDGGPEGARQLVVAPDAALPGLALTTYEGSVHSDRGLTDAPYVVPLPNNGLVELTAASGSPLRLLVSSRWKANDPDPAQNFCRVSGIVVAG
jgi:hypothetical protein